MVKMPCVGESPIEEPALGSKTPPRVLELSHKPMNWIAALEMSKVTEKLPPDFWMKTGMFVLIIAAIVLAIRFYQNSNKIFLSLGIAVVTGVVFFNWIYNRNEPEFLTPVIEPLANFFPSKGYEKKDVSDLDKQKKGGNVKPQKK